MRNTPEGDADTMQLLQDMVRLYNPYAEDYSCLKAVLEKEEAKARRSGTEMPVYGLRFADPGGREAGQAARNSHRGCLKSEKIEFRGILERVAAR